MASFIVFVDKNAATGTLQTVQDLFQKHTGSLGLVVAGVHGLSVSAPFQEASTASIERLQAIEAALEAAGIRTPDVMVSRGYPIVSEPVHVSADGSITYTC
jgi:hypothetical protein